PFVVNGPQFIFKAIEARDKVLFESAQGTMLDVDFGTYPFVTSSNPVAGGVCIGSGLAPTQIDEVLGVVKAYTTRVGEGPFPTELTDELGESLRQRGMEFGATTGRPRRCGWFDAVAVRHAVRISGITGLALTKLDVLTGFKKIPMCVAYRYDGKVHEEFPASIRAMQSAQPILEEMDGWDTPLTSVRRFSDLPANAQKYVRRMQKILETEGIWV